MQDEHQEQRADDRHQNGADAPEARREETEHDSTLSMFCASLRPRYFGLIKPRENATSQARAGTVIEVWQSPHTQTFVVKRS